MKKKHGLLKVLVFVFLLCQLFVSCTRENRNGNAPARQSGRNNVGVFTLTGIPMSHENKYVLLYDRVDGNVGIHLLGVESINEFTTGLETFNLVLPRINNGQVRIPLWSLGENRSRYSGNHSFNEIIIEIHNIPNISNEEDDVIETRLIRFVNFENGNATWDWTDTRRE